MANSEQKNSPEKIKLAVFCNEKPFSLAGLHKVSLETNRLVISGAGANLKTFKTHKIKFFIPPENQNYSIFPISLHGTAGENDTKGR